RAQLPPFEFTTRPLIVRAETDAEGKVQTLRVQLAAETHPSVTAELLAALTARFGAPSEKPEEALGLRPVHYAADGLEATLERPVPAALTLRVSRTGPAAPAAPNP
ncbi:MAG: hypothetical protein KC620_16260, partial [Myxococcales bacterium]|nr:hypothetical protein [Myxococcales bacterium]